MTMTARQRRSRGAAGTSPTAGGRQPHQRDRDEEGVFAPQPVAEKAEQDRAERPEAEADRETRPGEQRLQRLVAGGKERLPMIPAASVP